MGLTVVEDRDSWVDSFASHWSQSGDPTALLSFDLTLWASLSHERPEATWLRFLLGVIPLENGTTWFPFSSVEREVLRQLKSLKNHLPLGVAYRLYSTPSVRDAAFPDCNLPEENKRFSAALSPPSFVESCNRAFATRAARRKARERDARARLERSGNGKPHLAHAVAPRRARQSRC